MSNIFQNRVTPVRPKVLDESQLHIYAPTAQRNKKGIASFDEKDFNISKGKVVLKWPIDMMVGELSDPLKRPSLTKVLEDEFVNTNKAVSLINPLTGDKYTSTKSEIKLKRQHRTALTRPDLVMLDSAQFKEVDVGGYNKYVIRNQDPTATHTIVKVDPDDFVYSNELVKVKWPYGHDGEFGLVKVRDGVKGSLGFDDNDYLILDKDKFKANFEDWLSLQPNYAGDWDDKTDYVDPITNSAKRDGLGRTLLKLDKQSIGLSNVENRSFASRTYDEFGTLMKAHFDSKFGEKLDQTTWDDLLLDWLPPNVDKDTIQKWLTELENEDESIWESIRSANLMLGYYEDLTTLEAKHPATEELEGYIAFLLDTETYWSVVSEVWTNTNITHGDFYSLLETDGTKLKANEGTVGSVGTSGKWVHSDHVHPRDTTKLDVSKYEGHKIVITSELPTGNDFEGQVDNSNETIVNIPYVRTSKFIHNWKHNLNGFTLDENSELKFWAGTKEEFNGVSELPENVILYVEDDEEIIPGTIIFEDELDERGFPVDNNDLVITMGYGLDLEGKLLTIDNFDYVPGIKGPRRKLVPLEIKEVDGSSNYKLSVINTDGFLEKLTLPNNKLVTTDGDGNITPGANKTDIITKVIGSFEDNQLVIVDNETLGTVKTLSTGNVEYRLILTDGSGGVQLSNYDPNKLLQTNGLGGVVPSELIADKILHGGLVDLQPKKVVVASQAGYNVVEDWSPSNYESGAIVLAGDNKGEIKLHDSINNNRLLLSNGSGGLKEMPQGTHKQIISADTEGRPVWINNPISDGNLAQSVLYSNPTLLEAMEYNGLVAVILENQPSANSMHGNCIYYIG